MPTPDIINQLRKVLTKEVQVHRSSSFYGRECDVFYLLKTNISLFCYPGQIIISNGRMQYPCKIEIKELIKILSTACYFDMFYKRTYYRYNVNNYEFLYTVSMEKSLSINTTDSFSGTKRYSNAVFKLISDVYDIDTTELINKVVPYEGTFQIKYREVILEFNRSIDTSTNYLQNTVYVNKIDNAKSTLKNIRKMFNRLNKENIKSYASNIIINDLIYTKCSEFLENL